MLMKAPKAIGKLFQKFWPRLGLKLQFIWNHIRLLRLPYIPNLVTPKTFNETILVERLKPSYVHYSTYVDKIKVKDFVCSELGVQYIIPTLDVITEDTKNEQSKLLSAYTNCVIKPTHLSGRVMFVDRNGRITGARARPIETLEGWLRSNHFHQTGEYQYQNLEPRVLVEPNIGVDGVPPCDYKFFCVNGKARLIQVDNARFINHTRNLYTPDWKLLPFQLKYPKIPDGVGTPEKLQEMIRIAETLSSRFYFVRVDLYCVDNKIYFGELTFHPGLGCEPFDCYASDLGAGRLLLPEPRFPH